MSGFRSRVLRYLDEHGWRVGLALAVHRSLARLSPRYGMYWYRVYRQPLQGASRLGASGSAQYRWMDGYDELLAQLPRPVENLRERFEQNVQCLAVVKEQELMACAWFGFERFEEDEVRCTYILPANAVWDFDVFVFPKHRIGRIFLRTWEEANRKLSLEGFTQSLSRISVYNKNSITSHEKLGAEPLGGALFFKLGRLQVMMSSLSPYVAFSLRHPPQLDFRRRP